MEAVVDENFEFGCAEGGNNNIITFLAPCFR